MSTSRARLEICVDSADGALAAQAGGADRVELCASIAEGGTTPSLGMLRVTRKAIDIDLFSMIRPRGGDFHYSARELETMRVDIEAAREAGANGVVLGVLRPDGRVDEECALQLLNAARPMAVTFHRAFDMTPDPIEALEALIGLGFDRVLTSGQEVSAPNGLPLLRKLVDHARGRIVVMPGCGIRAHNLANVKAQTGAQEFHASAWESHPSAMLHRNERVNMGHDRAPSEYERSRTSTDKVRALIAALS